jgi:hypothetical protein
VQKVLIPIVNDTMREGSEIATLNLDLPSPAGVVIGPRSTATLTIVDNDQPGVIRFEKPVFLTNEPATGSSLAAVNIVRTGTNLGSGVTVDFAVMDGTATGGGVDYAYANQSTTLTFLAGEVKKTVNITVFADTLIESNETVILKLSNPTLGAALAPPVGAAPGVTSPDAQLAIVSDDRPGVFQFSAATYTTTEALGVTVNATITVNRIGTAATLGSDVTVDYLITGGTASFGGDYVLPNSPAIGGRLRFGAGVTSQTFNVMIQPDTAGEGAETIVLSLSNPSAGATLGTPSTTTINVNDIQTSITFGAPVFNTPETGTVQVPIFRTGPVAGVTSTAVFTAVAGTATAGLDFTPTPPGGLLVTFLPGSTKQTLTVPIVADQLPEGGEFLVMVLSSPSPGTVLGPIAAAFLTITDDDPGTFRFTTPAFTVKEGEPVAVISVTRTGTAPQLQQSQTVSVSTANSTAIAGTDYTAVSGLQLTFAPGVTTQSFVIPIADNEVKDVPRSFLALLSPVTPGTTVSVGGTVLVTIQDND